MSRTLLFVWLLLGCGSDPSAPGSDGALAGAAGAPDSTPVGGGGGGGRTGPGGEGGGSGVDGEGGASQSGAANGGAPGGEAGDAGDAGVSGSAGNAGASGCITEAGAPEGYLDRYASGTRLLARVLRAEGLPEVFVGFFDSELGTECAFARASDDELRCLPVADRIGGQTGYADASCTTPLFRAEGGCLTEPAYIRTELECGDKFDVSTAVPFTGDEWFSGSGANCESEGTPTEPDWVMPGAPLPASAFVRGRTRDLPGSCRGALRIVEADDGAHGPMELADLGTGAACRPETGPCDAKRTAYETELYEDSACSGEPAVYAEYYERAACGSPDMVRPLSATPYRYRAGELVTASLHSNVSGCEPALDKEWIGSVYELGAPLDDGDVANFRTTDVGTGRLSLSVLDEDQMALLADTGLDLELFDTELDVRCTVQRFADGTRRCVPTPFIPGPLTPNEYGDSACSTPARSCVAPGGCEGLIMFDTALDPTACSPGLIVSAVWTLGTPVTSLYTQTGDDCLPSTSTPSDYYHATSLPPSELPLVEIRNAE